MKFEEALKAMREGKEITRPVLISDDDTIVMGVDVTGENHLLRNRLYLYHTSDSAKLRRDTIMDSDSVLADDWEIYEEKQKQGSDLDVIIKVKGCFLPTAEIKSVTINDIEIKGVKQIIPGFDNKTIGLYFDTDRLEIKWENPDESEMPPITQLAREMAKFANIKE